MKQMVLFFCLSLLFALLGQAVPVQASAFTDQVSDMAEIKAVRVSSTQGKVRIVVDASREVDYATMVLSSPGRVVVDISHAWLSPQVQKSIDIDSSLASKVRAAQFDKDTVRVVVETEASADAYDVFSLAGGTEPYRVVMDFGSGSAIPDADGAEIQTMEADSKSHKDVPAAPPEDSSSAPDYSAVQTVFTPGLAGKKIALDAGHGGNDTGAIGPTGVTEKSITLRIAQETKRLLLAAGAEVIMTHEADTEVSPKHAAATDVEELQARCDVADKAGADIFVSIHMDSFTSSEAKGTTGYFYEKGNGSGKKLAEAVRAGVVKALGTDSRGTKSCNFYVVKHTSMPAALLETAFVSNQKEEQLLNSEDGIKKAAQGIVAGINTFFG